MEVWSAEAVDLHLQPGVLILTEGNKDYVVDITRSASWNTALERSYKRKGVFWHIHEVLLGL